MNIPWIYLRFFHSFTISLGPLGAPKKGCVYAIFLRTFASGRAIFFSLLWYKAVWLVPSETKFCQGSHKKMDWWAVPIPALFISNSWLFHVSLAESSYISSVVSPHVLETKLRFSSQPQATSYVVEDSRSQRSLAGDGGYYSPSPAAVETSESMILLPCNHEAWWAYMQICTLIKKTFHIIHTIYRIYKYIYLYKYIYIY